MRKICTGCLVIVGLGAGVVLALAFRSSRETGKGFLQCLMEMPADARRYAEDLRGRAEQAVASGRQAAVEKQSEIDAVLTGVTRTSAADGSDSDT